MLKMVFTPPNNSTKKPTNNLFNLLKDDYDKLSSDRSALHITLSEYCNIIDEQKHKINNLDSKNNELTSKKNLYENHCSFLEKYIRDLRSELTKNERKITL